MFGLAFGLAFGLVHALACGPSIWPVEKRTTEQRRWVARE